MIGLNDILSNNTVSNTINSVKNYLQIGDDVDNSIDAFPVPFSNDVVLYDDIGNQLASFRGACDYNLPVSNSSQATPSGTRITKGIVIGLHSINISEVIITPKQLKLDTITTASQYYTSKLSSLVGIFSPQTSSQISKASNFLRGLYSKAEGIAGTTKEAVNIYKNIIGTDKSQIINQHNLLENLVYSSNNGNYVVHYLGKGYRKMTFSFKHNYSNSKLVISCNFTYSPEIDTEQIMISAKYKINKIVKGLTTTKTTQKQELNSTMQDQTLLKASFNSVKNILSSL